jgi:hypothetical protein
MQTQTKPATPRYAHLGAALLQMAANPMLGSAPAPQAPAAPLRIGKVGNITVLVAANPKKPGSKSAARFSLYQTGQSVAAYVAACVAAGQSQRNATADLAWDVKHGFIKLA